MQTFTSNLASGSQKWSVLMGALRGSHNLLFLNTYASFIFAYSIPAEGMTLDCALNLDVYLKRQWNEKVGQEERKSKSWNKVEDK